MSEKLDQNMRNMSPEQEGGENKEKTIIKNEEKVSEFLEKYKYNKLYIYCNGRTAENYSHGKNLKSIEEVKEQVEKIKNEPWSGVTSLSLFETSQNGENNFMSEKFIDIDY